MKDNTPVLTKVLIISGVAVFIIAVILAIILSQQ